MGNLKLSHVGPSQKQASGTNQRIKALRQGRHWVWGLAHRCAFTEGIISINRALVYNQVCRLLYDIDAVSHFLRSIIVLNWYLLN